MANGTAKITRTFGTPTNRDKWTWSAWVKIADIQEQGLFFGYIDANNYTHIEASSTGQFKIYNHLAGVNNANVRTSNLMRDPSAFYHLVVVWDSGNAVEADRVKMYINGVEVTYTSTTYPGQNDNSSINGNNLHEVGAKLGGYGFAGVMSNVQFVDGSALAPTEFGEVDSTSGIWKIKTTAYATPGNNGFFLTMEDRTNLDLDSSSNAHTFATTGTLTATYDNPSNNFSTWNPLYIPTSNLPTFENGNTTTVHATTSGGWRTMESTLGVSSGKWYWECIGGNSSGHIYTGVCSLEWLQTGDPASTGPSGEMGFLVAQPSYGVYGLNGNLAYSNTSGYGNLESGWTTGGDNSDYWSVYVDLDNHKIYWSINGTIQNSGTGADLQTGFTYIPCVSLYNSEAAGAMANFGNGTFGSTALTGTTYSDNDSIGTFKYSPNYGGASTFDGSAKNFMALCTKNIKAYGG